MLRLVDVSKRYGSRWALARVSLELQANAVVLLTGENGAGKTTLLKIMATLQRPTSGRVELFGLAAQEHSEAIRRRVGVIAHQAHLYYDLTPRENLVLVEKLTGVRGSIDGLLARVGLQASADRPVRELSAGMKRRVSVARLLLQRPQLALLDEPFTQLDPQGTTLMEEVIRELRAEGALVIVATHDVERGRTIADAHLTLEGGRALSLVEVAA